MHVGGHLARREQAEGPRVSVDGRANHVRGRGCGSRQNARHEHAAVPGAPADQRRIEFGVGQAGRRRPEADHRHERDEGWRWGSVSGSSPPASGSVLALARPGGSESWRSSDLAPTTVTAGSGRRTRGRRRSPSRRCIAEPSETVAHAQPRASSRSPSRDALWNRARGSARVDRDGPGGDVHEPTPVAQGGAHGRAQRSGAVPDRA